MEKIRYLINHSPKVYHLAFILTITLVFPFFVHLLPSFNGVPAGAVLLPMFYISVPALYLFKDVRLVALSVSLAPIVNHIVSGRPAMELMTILAFELMVYTFITCRLLHKAHDLVQRNAGGISYLITKLISSSVLLLPLNILKTDAWTFFTPLYIMQFRE
ncbi:MAG: hypothetical protein IPM26_05585 [Saprospiraceae bacterium]|nr:hypothetical protein [Saprospiraceae bacterium]